MLLWFWHQFHDGHSCTPGNEMWDHMPGMRQCLLVSKPTMNARGTANVIQKQQIYCNYWIAARNNWNRSNVTLKFSRACAGHCLFFLWIAILFSLILACTKIPFYYAAIFNKTISLSMHLFLWIYRWHHTWHSSKALYRNIFIHYTHCFREYLSNFDLLCFNCTKFIKKTFSFPNASVKFKHRAFKQRFFVQKSLLYQNV